ncbi:hypothetical protein SDC9_145556 [bioreactor metagenome]|uniref:Uncharacterized protein n=1 Tax=bioreactor metagenome TaxID=1076179 RepID=A0A645E994_9ZZZZ
MHEYDAQRHAHRPQDPYDGILPEHSADLGRGHYHGCGDSEYGRAQHGLEPHHEEVRLEIERKADAAEGGVGYTAGHEDYPLDHYEGAYDGGKDTAYGCADEHVLYQRRGEHQGPISHLCRLRSCRGPCVPAPGCSGGSAPASPSSPQAHRSL